MDDPDGADGRPPYAFETDQHEEAFELLCAGHTTSEVANRVGVEPRTIRRWGVKYGWTDDPRVVLARGEQNRASARSLRAAITRAQLDNAEKSSRAAARLADLVLEAVDHFEPAELTPRDFGALVRAFGILFDKAEAGLGRPAQLDLSYADLEQQHGGDRMEALYRLFRLDTAALAELITHVEPIETNGQLVPGSGGHDI